MPTSRVLERAALVPTTTLESGPVEPEIHVTSVLIYARPEALSLVLGWLERQPGAEVHASDEQGKVIVVIESAEPQTALDLMDQSREQPGVIDAALVYHELVSPQEPTP